MAQRYGAVVAAAIVWALAGWCGTPWRHPPIPPSPDPEPWLFVKIVGILGGLAGGWFLSRMFDGTPLPALTVGYVAATSVGAFIGGRVLSELASVLRVRAPQR